jgi:glycosyltransferase involved in cell wall biosynthesis
MQVLSGLLFFPRGGSAHVARALAGELAEQGHDVTVLSGSLRSRHADARVFYAGLDVCAVEFDAGDAPMHPSYEDRPGAPDACFGRVGDEAYSQHVAAWCRALERTDAAACDVLHLHHLTPLNEAAARVAPDVPVVAHLHGTELLFLEAVEEGRQDWPHAAAWARRMRRWAQAASRVVLLSESQLDRATDLLGIDAERCVVVPNGVDTTRFAPHEVDRAAVWRRRLVEEPQGWRSGQGEGTVRYLPEDIAHLVHEPVVVSVGRFSAVKRTDLLIRAFARAARVVPGRPSLVLVGGHPGEHEGLHPADVIEQEGARDVFLAGWHDHDELPEMLCAADLLALASVREQFGLVLVEAMACERPVVAVDRFGPADIVEDGETGWLVEPDDETAMAHALAAALRDARERERRGRAARESVVDRFAWPAVAAHLAEVLLDAADRPAAGGLMTV